MKRTLLVLMLLTLSTSLCWGTPPLDQFTVRMVSTITIWESGKQYEGQPGGLVVCAPYGYPVGVVAKGGSPDSLREAVNIRRGEGEMSIEFPELGPGDVPLLFFQPEEGAEAAPLGMIISDDSGVSIAETPAGFPGDVRFTPHYGKAPDPRPIQ